MNESLPPIAPNLERSLFNRAITDLQSLTDRVFARLLMGQWLAALLCALFVSPRTWQGTQSAIHVHVLAALFIGGLLTVFPVYLIRFAPGQQTTRYVTASAQLLFSALFIHLMGGRIEAHFHIFGSLALLSFYRDYRVFVPAVGITVLDHSLRGVFWPESVFGVINPSILRTLEHGGWVLFETGFLLWGVRQSRQHLLTLSRAQAELGAERDGLESRIAERTQELAETRDYFENVINSLDAHLCILDEQGDILTTNQAWRSYGSQRDAGAKHIDGGSNYLAICRQADGACRVDALALADAIEAVILGQRAGYVGEYACHEPGRRRWFQVRVSPFIGRTKASAVVAHVDVTDRVLATEASLEESRRAESLARVITESPNEVYIFNQSSLRFEVVNDGAVQATGYSRDELLSMTPIDLKPEFDLRSFREQIKPLAESRVASLEFQSENRRQDGTVYPVRVSLNAAVYNDTPVYVAFVTDLSEIRRLEGRLSQAQKLESIGQLAAGVAHEINTPMQCVSNNVKFLQDCQLRLFEIIDRLVETLNSEATSWAERREIIQRLIDENLYERVASLAPDALNDAAEASRRVVEIVRAMQVMSHPGGTSKSPTDINEVVRSAITVSTSRWKYAADLTPELDPGLPAILAHPSELNQVVLNLIVNAADAIAEKNDEGVLGQITVRTRQEEDAVCIDVQDTGGGIPDSIRNKIFDPFFTTKDVGKGTGQGLAISYDAVVNQHGGDIEVLSTEGVGTTFVIRLPMTDKSSTATLEALPQEEKPTFMV